MSTLFGMFGDLARIALGLTPLSLLAWAYVSVLMCVVGPIFAQVAPAVVDPPARLIAADPRRVAVWMPLSTLLLIGGTITLIITIFGAVLAPIIAILLTLVGYIAVARLLGDVLLRRGAAMADSTPWLATLLGLILIRLVRLTPYVGALIHSIVLWVGFAAAMCMAIQQLRQWWQRRLPDERQFQGETLVEWYPEGDPQDGKPSVGTGRPVLDNIRGDEPSTPDHE